MDRILVDTDVFSYILGDRPEAALFETALDDAELCISFITEGELRFGALNRNWGERRVQELEDAISEVETLHSDSNVVSQFARLVNDGRTSGLPIGQPDHRADAWIAAVALANDLSLATNNIRHFDGIVNLNLIQPHQQ